VSADPSAGRPPGGPPSGISPRQTRRKPAGPRSLWRDGGLLIARIGGIPILLSPSWLLSVVIVVVFAGPVISDVIPGTTGGAAIAISVGLAVLLGLSVLAHELGHCLAARACGIPVLRVRLYLLGGVSELGRSPTGPGQDAAVAAAGPGVSALLAVVAGLMVGSFPSHTIGWLITIQIALANAIVAVFNLLPALPMDGGHVLRATVWWVSGRRRFGTVAGIVGGWLVAAGLVIWAAWLLTHSSSVALLQALIVAATAVFVGFGAYAEGREERLPAWPDDVDIRSLARPVLQLPAETPVVVALQIAEGRPVVLTGRDGIAVGLLDPTAAMGLALQRPQAPAGDAADPVRPEAVVLADDTPSDIVERVRATGSGQFLLVDRAGRPEAVLPAAEVRRVLSVSGDRHRGS